MAIMDLIKGTVTPFGSLNDEERKVKSYIGKKFVNGKLRFHPLENTATIWIKVKDLINLVKEHGNEIVEF